MKYPFMAIMPAMFAICLLPLKLQGAFYSISVIAGPGGIPFIAAGAITNTGSILGTANGTVAIWQNGATQLIASPANGEFSAEAINSSSSVVGLLYPNDSGTTAAAVWVNGQFTSLTPLTGDTGAVAYSVNETGMIVGASESSNGTSRAVVWQNGIATDLSNLLNGEPSFAKAINNAGQILARSVENSYLIDGTSVTPITSPTAGASVYANAVNNSGQVTGVVYTVGGQGQPFVWSNGTMAIGAPLSEIAPYDTEATSINDDGIMVGFSVSADGSQNAFIWNGLTPPEDLNTLIAPSSGWDLVTANSINNAGDIVGQGYFNGELEAFLLTPTTSPSITTPEPATFTLLALPFLPRRRQPTTKH